MPLDSFPSDSPFVDDLIKNTIFYPYTDSSSKIMRGNFARGGMTSRQTIFSGLNSSMNIASVRSSMLASTRPTSSRSSTPTRSRLSASLRPSTYVPHSEIPAS
ncbi:hypothetical protein SUGI_0122620 [Cryptomeria japonica]|nr:hypothetical protein SUGI_0122620 [Cryptomeria japonica]